MPYPNEHAARVHDPGQYESFARKKITTGISAIFGIKNNKSEIQAYRFDKDIFTLEEARKWLLKHNIKYISLEKASGKVKAFISLQCTTLSFSPDEILALIDSTLLSKIKAKDSHPFFQAYSICHEGISQPTILGEKSRPIHWTRQAVESIKKVIAKGVKFFKGHNRDNSTDDREALGEVVADTQKVINGVLHHIVVGYFPNQERVKDADICSQEADWNLFEKAGEWFASSIKNLTGIALSNSKIDSPAFVDARRLGMVQAFNTIQSDENILNRSIGNMPEELKTVAFADLVTELKRRNTFPTQIFSLDEIRKDREISPFFEKLDKLEKDNQVKDKNLKDLEEEKKVLSKQVNSVTAKDRLFKLLDEDKLIKTTEKQRKFIKERFTNIEDTTDEGFKKYIETEIAERKKLLDIEGIPEGDRNNGNFIPPNGDMTKAENNPLLEEDFEQLT